MRTYYCDYTVLNVSIWWNQIEVVIEIVIEISYDYVTVKKFTKQTCFNNLKVTFIYKI